MSQNKSINKSQIQLSIDFDSLKDEQQAKASYEVKNCQQSVKIVNINSRQYIYKSILQRGLK